MGAAWPQHGRGAAPGSRRSDSRYASRAQRGRSSSGHVHGDARRCEAAPVARPARAAVRSVGARRLRHRSAARVRRRRSRAARRRAAASAPPHARRRRAALRAAGAAGPRAPAARTAPASGRRARSRRPRRHVSQPSASATHASAIAATIATYCHGASRSSFSSRHSERCAVVVEADDLAAPVVVDRVPGELDRLRASRRRAARGSARRPLAGSAPPRPISMRDGATAAVGS